jgi:DNA-binding MarR family transcriptional regulator
MIDSVDQDQCARQVFSSQLTIGFTRSADATGIECRSEVEVTAPESDGLLRTLSNVVVNLSRDGERDLTFRQLAVFLICCTEAGDQTAKELSDALEISAPAMGRVAERLTRGGMLLRKPNLDDRRSFLLAKTPSGLRLLEELRLRVANMCRC